jgi:hypothetical protein
LALARGVPYDVVPSTVEPFIPRPPLDPAFLQKVSRGD